MFDSILTRIPQNVKIPWDRVMGLKAQREREPQAVDFLSLIVGCGVVAGAFTAIVWLIASYSLDWAFFR